MKTLSQRLQEYRTYRHGGEEGQTQEIVLDLKVINSFSNGPSFKIVHHGIIGVGSTITAAANDFFRTLKASLSTEKDKSEKAFFQRSEAVKTISKLCE